MDERYKFHPKAKEELKNSVKWHETNRENSGQEMAISTYNKIHEIVNNPEGRSADKREVRWASVSDFPYKIFYIFKKPIVWILAVWHNSRKPNGWKKRIDDV